MIFRQRDPDQVLVQRPLRHRPVEPAAGAGRAQVRLRRQVRPVQEQAGAFVKTQEERRKRCRKYFFDIVFCFSKKKKKEK